jgi:hypothetical protein
MPANSLGTLSPTVVVLDTIQFLKKTFPVITRITTNFSQDATLLNETVISRVVTPPPTHDYVAPAAAGTGYNPQDAATTVDVPVTINKHKFATLTFTDTEMASTPRDLPMEQKQALAYSLGRQLLIDLFALVTPTNFPTTYQIVDPKNSNKHTVLAMRQLLVANGATINRFGVVNPIVFAALGQDASVISKFNFGTSDPDLQAGTIDDFGGFSQISEYAELNTANSLAGFFGGKEALVMAARVPEIPDISIPGNIENVADPDSGLTLQYREYYDMMAGQFNVTLTWMYGVAKGVAAHGAILVQNAGGNPN